MKFTEDGVKLITEVDIRKIQEKAIKDAITYSAFRDDHQWDSYKAYDVMTKYAEEIGRGNL